MVSIRDEIGEIRTINGNVALDTDTVVAADAGQAYVILYIMISDASTDASVLMGGRIVFRKDVATETFNTPVLIVGNKNEAITLVEGANIATPWAITFGRLRGTLSDHIGVSAAV